MVRCLILPMDAIVRTKGLTNPRDRLDFNPSASQTGSGLTPRLLFSFINEDHDTHPDHYRDDDEKQGKPKLRQSPKCDFRVM